MFEDAMHRDRLLIARTARMHYHSSHPEHFQLTFCVYPSMVEYRIYRRRASPILPIMQDYRSEVLQVAAELTRCTEDKSWSERKNLFTRELTPYFSQGVARVEIRSYDSPNAETTYLALSDPHEQPEALLTLCTVSQYEPNVRVNVVGSGLFTETYTQYSPASWGELTEGIVALSSEGYPTVITAIPVVRKPTPLFSFRLGNEVSLYDPKEQRSLPTPANSSTAALPIPTK